MKKYKRIRHRQEYFKFFENTRDEILKIEGFSVLISIPVFGLVYLPFFIIMFFFLNVFGWLFWFFDYEDEYVLIGGKK